MLQEHRICRRMASCAIALAPALTHALPITVTDNNAHLTYRIDEPGGSYGYTSDPVQFPRAMHWLVDGHDMLVYPTSAWIDVGHLHLGSHVRTTQIHAQGPMLGYGTSPMQGRMVGGAVYTVEGARDSCERSRISEKIDIANKTSGETYTVIHRAMGYRPTASTHGSGEPVPDISAWNVSGVTTTALQGNYGRPSLHDPDANTPIFTFGPSTVSSAKFNGFNPATTVQIPPGATLTMITELVVRSKEWWCELPILVLEPAP